MVLGFQNERIQIILRIRGWKIQDIIDRGTSKNKRLHSISRWVSGETSPSSFGRSQILADILEVPVGFFYYNMVHINMRDMQVEILIHETKEAVFFDFLSGDRILVPKGEK